MQLEQEPLDNTSKYGFSSTAGKHCTVLHIEEAYRPSTASVVVEGHVSLSIPFDMQPKYTYLMREYHTTWDGTAQDILPAHPDGGVQVSLPPALLRDVSCLWFEVRVSETRYLSRFYNPKLCLGTFLTAVPHLSRLLTPPEAPKSLNTKPPPLYPGSRALTGPVPF